MRTRAKPLVVPLASFGGGSLVATVGPRGKMTSMLEAVSISLSSPGRVGVAELVVPNVRVLQAVH